MLRSITHVLIVFALLVQGVASAGADFAAADHESQQHCAGHDMSAQDCACCPEGVADTNCTVQCSMLLVAPAMQAPSRLELRSDFIPMPDAAIRSRSYTPVVPPPIF